MEGRTSARRRRSQGYLWIPWAKGFSGSHSLRLFIALLSLFSSQLARDIQFGNSLATCGLRLSIITIIQYVLCNQSIFFSFIPHSFTSTSLHQDPHKILITVGLRVLVVGSDFPWLSQMMATSSGGSLPWLYVCPS